MRNRITVNIGGQDYTLVATEDEGYVRGVAGYVDQKVRELMDSGSLSMLDNTVLAAVNIADEYFKEQETTERLRAQLKASAEEATGLEQELSEAKREIFRLQNNRR